MAVKKPTDAGGLATLDTQDVKPRPAVVPGSPAARPLWKRALPFLLALAVFFAAFSWWGLPWWAAVLLALGAWFAASRI